MLANFIDVCKIPILFVRRDENSARGWLSGRASPSHGGGHWFESSTAHHDRSETAQTAVFFCSKAFKVDKKCLLINGLADILTLQPTFFYSSRQGEKQTS